MFLEFGYAMDIVKDNMNSWHAETFSLGIWNSIGIVFLLCIKTSRVSVTE